MAYQSSDAYQNLYKQIIGNTGPGGYEWNDSNTNSKLGQLHDEFANQFQTMVGRAPTDAESANYFQTVGQSVLQSPGGLSNTSPFEISQATTGYLNTHAQQAAKDYTTQQLQSQQGEANRLSDLFRTQGNDAINKTEQSLLDYQSRLFEKLRPNLITSLQSQGLLDTGGLNSAMAGSQADLANSVQPFLAQQRLQNEQGANQISFAGASAPLQFQQAQALNQVPYLQSQGQNAVNQGYNTFLTNLNYQNQLGLQNNAARLQADAQPSFMRTMGQSFAGSFGSGWGNATNPYGQSEMFKNVGQGFGGAGGSSGAKAAMA